MYLLTSLFSLHIWACHWKCWGTRNISVLFVSHLQCSPIRGWWSQIHLEAAWAVILCCAGKTSCRTPTSLSVLMLEGKDKVKLFAYPISCGWGVFKISFDNLLFFCTDANFWVFWQYNSFITLHVKVETIIFWETFWKLFLRKVIWRKKKGKMLHICTQAERRNWWGCRRELETLYQSTLKWSYLLNSARGNSRNRKSRRELRGSKSGIIQS